MTRTRTRGTFRFLHAADIHLDSPLRGLSRYDSAPVAEIRNATRQAFEGLIELALEEQVDFLLLAGDLYDGTWKDFGTGIFLSKQIGRLLDPGIQVFAVAGNHDAESKITRALHTPANMHFFPTKKADTCSLEDLGVAIHGQGFKNQQVPENLARDYPPAVPGAFNIGLLHTSLDGREGHAEYAPCKLDDLRAKDYQYWALGHVHEREVVCEDPWAVFPGCLQGRHIRETGDKGATLVTVEDGEVRSVVPCPLDVFRWQECIVDLEDVDQVEEVATRTRESLGDVLEASDGRHVAIRVRLQGACSIADTLAANPVLEEQKVRGLAAEVGGDQVWVEKVLLEVQSKRDLDLAAAGDDALGGLLREILDLAEDPREIPGLSETLDKLRSKLPPAAVTGEEGLGLDDPEELSKLIGEAKRMLLGRLLTQGERS